MTWDTDCVRVVTEFVKFWKTAVVNEFLPSLQSGHRSMGSGAAALQWNRLMIRRDPGPVGSATLWSCAVWIPQPWVPRRCRRWLVCEPPVSCYLSTGNIAGKLRAKEVTSLLWLSTCFVPCGKREPPRLTGDGVVVPSWEGDVDTQECNNNGRLTLLFVAGTVLAQILPSDTLYQRLYRMRAHPLPDIIRSRYYTEDVLLYFTC